VGRATGSRKLLRSPREPTNPQASSPYDRADCPVTGTPLLHDPQWIYEPKFDGFRGVLYVSGRECYIRSKRGNVLSRFKDLALRLGPSFTPGTLFSTVRWSHWMTRVGWTPHIAA
jgi:ATP-dependent DNA ligase